jgi:hypothetical protein
VAVAQTLRGSVDPVVTIVPGRRPTLEQIASAPSGSGWVGSSCGYRFEVGRQYLIYAFSTSDGRWTTSTCSRTTLLDKADEDLAYARSIPPSGTHGRIYGTIERTVADPRAPGRPQRLPATGVAVSIVGDAAQLTAVVDERGRIDVEVPAGAYTVTPVVPETVRVNRSRRPFTVPARGCAPVHFSLTANGRIEGYAVRENGRPAAKARVYAIPVELTTHDEIRNASLASMTTGDDGRFSISPVLPGRYYLAVNAEHGPRLNSPFVSTSVNPRAETDSSQIIDLADGQHAGGFTVVARSLAETTISGVVLSSDGRPVADVNVRARVPDFGLGFMSRARTDSRGAFRLRVLSGLTYVIHASQRTPQGERKAERTLAVAEPTNDVRMQFEPVGARRPLAPNPPVALAPSGAVGQSMAAYDRGDYDTAFRILKPIVYDPAIPREGLPDPWAMYYLGQMFNTGRGTETDIGLACAMFFVARNEFAVRFNEEHQLAPILEAERTTCGPNPVANPDVIEMLGGNFLDGVVRTVLNLGGGDFVVVDRAGVHLDTMAGTGEGALLVDMGEVALPMRHTAISVVDDTGARVRHFIEFFVWTTSIRDGHVVRSLQWRPMEIAGTRFHSERFETIVDVPDAPYPDPTWGLEHRDRVVLEATWDGHVAWFIRGTQKSGVFRDR